MRGNPMGDASFNPPPSICDEPPPLPLPLLLPGTTAKGDQILGLVSAGWTNERHITYISSMEASFVDQFYGVRKHGPDANKGTDARPHDGGGQPASTWVRRFRPYNAAANRRGDDVNEEAPMDDYGSGTDSVRKKVQTYGREAKTCCARENFIGKSKEVSDQNFSEEDVEANDELCKRRRPSSTSAEPNDQPT